MNTTNRTWMIVASLACAVLPACAEHDVTGLKAPTMASKKIIGSYSQFFVAWSATGTYQSSPIQTQAYLDSRQYRQYADWNVNSTLLSFAAANPGKLYIAGDEPDQSCVTPYDYAGIYHDFVTAVRGADPTARFSNAGFADPNDQCTPTPGEPYRSSMHYTSYATDFYNAYIQRYGAAPPVNEWRFHNFAQWIGEDIPAWTSQVGDAAAWSVAHGANMVLGSWGWIGDSTSSDAAYSDLMKRAMAFLAYDSRINQAAYWAWEKTGSYHRYMANADGTLTPVGQTYVNPVTEVPASPTLIGSSGCHGKLRWTSTSSLWRAEAEFWVQYGGAGSFVYNNTDLVSPGVTETPVHAYNCGDRVEGRVRYYISSDKAAAWTSFSSPFLMH